MLTKANKNSKQRDTHCILTKTNENIKQKRHPLYTDKGQ